MLHHLARLRHWLRHSWISRISLFDWLRDWAKRWPGRNQPFPRQFLPLLEVLENRVVFSAVQYTLTNY